MKKKCIIIIAVVCVAVVAVAGTVFGVRAYNDYTLQQQTEERIKSIDDTYADFLDETDRSKKLEKLSDFMQKLAVDYQPKIDKLMEKQLDKPLIYFSKNLTNLKI